MRPCRSGSWRRLPLVLTLLVCVACVATDALAQDVEVPDETERWVPSFSLRSGVTASNMSADTSSQVRALAGPLGGTLLPTLRVFVPAGGIIPPSPSDIDALRPAMGEETVMGPWVGTSVELMTPGLAFLPTRPRLFAHGDVQYNFSVPRSIARSGKPAAAPGIGLPPGFRLEFDAVTAAAITAATGQQKPAIPGIKPAYVPAYPFPASSTLLFNSDAGTQNADPIVVVGQGSKVEVSEYPWVYQGGAGAAFTFELFERRFRLKPSVEYQKRTLTVSGVANAAHYSAVTGAVGSTTLPVFNVIQLSFEQELDLHGLGPGFEIELDTWQAGPFMLSVFASGQAYRVLGDTKVSALSDPSVPCAATDGSNLQQICQRLFDFEPPGSPKGFGSGQTGNPDSSGLGANDVYGEFNFEIDPWTYQAGVGLRFRAVPDRWVPEALSKLELPDFEMPEWMPW